MMIDVDHDIKLARRIASDLFNDGLPDDLTQLQGLFVGATLAGIALGLMAKHGAILAGGSEDILDSAQRIMRTTAEEVALQ